MFTAQPNSKDLIKVDTLQGWKTETQIPAFHAIGARARGAGAIIA